MWFLDHHRHIQGSLVRFDQASEDFTFFDMPDELTDPHFLVVDPDGPDGIIWLTAWVSGAIGTFDPATEAFDSLTLSDPAFSRPMGISMSSTEIWWAETFLSGHGGVGRFTPRVPPAEDIPIAGDFDRDGHSDDVAVFRPSNHLWYYDYNHDGSTDERSGPWRITLPILPGAS